MVNLHTAGRYSDYRRLSHPSCIHTGFELGMILTRGKPVILLFEEGKNPSFVDNVFTSRLIKSEYNKNNLNEVLEWCLEEARGLSNRRFTLFISPDIEKFLEEKSISDGTSKSEFIRSLIEKEMNTN